MANVLDQSYAPTTNFGFLLRFASNNSVKIGQGFKPSVAASVSQVKLKLKKNNSPTGNIWVTIEADSAGAPSGVALGTSDNVDVTGLGAEALVTFAFSTPSSVLTSGSQYWIVIQGNYSFSNTVNIEFRTRQDSSDLYNKGQVSTFDATSWTGQDGGGNFYDVGFEEYYDSATLATGSKAVIFIN